MSDRSDKASSHDNSGRHITTRRGFVTGLGFGVVSLYALWAAYGAAPTGFSFLTAGAEGGGGHGGGGMSPETFRRYTEAFIAENELPDGSVKPGLRTRLAPAASEAGHAERDGDTYQEASATTTRDAGDPRGESGQAHAPGDNHGTRRHGGEREQHADGSAPIDVFILAERFAYQPSVLRLERGVPYRFRMMGMDVNHGASITLNVRLAGHMMRAPAGRLSEMIMTFSRPGEYLVYCTVYCGEGHDLMQGKIIVT